MLFLLAAMMLQVGLAQEQGAAPAKQCVLEGTAVDATTGEALPKVTVKLVRESSQQSSGYVRTTDASGRFRFEGVAAGDYELVGDRPGYLEGQFGATKPVGAGITLHLKAGDELSELPLKLTRFSVVSGKVLDEDGEPVSGARINAISTFWARGQREYGTTEQGTTNDRGEYRISGLSPGRYYFRVSTGDARFTREPGGPVESLLPVFYPDSLTIDHAAGVQLEPAQNLDGIDFKLKTGPVFQIRGAIKTARGVELDQLEVSAENSIQKTGVLDFDSDVDQKGNFDIVPIPAGHYELEVIDPRHNVLTAVPIEIRTRDVTGMVISLPGPIELKGVVRWPENGSAPAAIFALPPQRTFDGAYRAPVEPNGAFTIKDVPAGEYVIGVDGRLAGEYVKSILYNQQEVLGEVIDLSGGSAGALEIVISGGAGQIEGTISGTQDKPAIQEKAGDSSSKVAAPLQAVLVSERQRLYGQRARFETADESAHFSFTDLPPGKYHAFAVAGGVDWGVWENEDFLKQIQSEGVEIEVSENQKKQVPLTPISADTLERAIQKAEQQ